MQFDGLNKFINDYSTAIKGTGAFILGLMGLIFAIICTAKSISAFGKGQGGEGVKWIVYGVIVIAIASAGILAIISIVNNITKGAGSGFKFNNGSFGD